MIDVLLYATVTFVFLVGAGWLVVKGVKAGLDYDAWAERKKYPVLWVEVPLLVLLWVILVLWWFFCGFD